MSMPAVSIVIPCYNGGRFFDGLFASLAAQTFRDFELIVVDDGSTDALTLQELATLDPAIRVIRQKNSFLPAARNAGIRAARAEFVLPLDCDDTLEPAFLSKTVDLLRAAPADTGFVFTDIRLSGDLDGELSCHFNRFDQLFFNNVAYCMLMRKSAWEAVGGYDETMRDGAEDWEFNIRLAARFKALHAGEPLFIYRVSAEGMLTSHSNKMHGTIWGGIRSRHRDLYRPAALAACWRATRNSRRRISLPVAAGLLGAAIVLPKGLFNRLFFQLLSFTRSQRLARSRRKFSSTALLSG